VFIRHDERRLLARQDHASHVIEFKRTLDDDDTVLDRVFVYRETQAGDHARGVCQDPHGVTS
jgi:hypothetical protein